MSDILGMVWKRLLLDPIHLGKMIHSYFTEKGFCVRGDLCVFDHGVDPVVVEKYSVPPQYPPG